MGPIRNTNLQEKKNLTITFLTDFPSRKRIIRLRVGEMTMNQDAFSSDCTDTRKVFKSSNPFFLFSKCKPTKKLEINNSN